MVAFCLGFDGVAWSLADGSAGVVPVRSGVSLVVAAVGSGDDVGAYGVVVRPSGRVGRPCTAEALLSRAIT